ncbi:MAG TPA: universal stress protein [Methanoregulaceae archaeon]|nr:universal stress protein [Methanoregulaceae archaeon]
MFERILFPTDFSEHAKRALDCIAELPGSREVILLHVLEDAKPEREQWVEDAIEDSIRHSLDEEEKQLEKAGVLVNSIVRPVTTGSIGEVIVEVAEQEEASIVVMSARGKNLTKGILLGSVSSHVLRHAEIHLLIMRDKVIEGLTGKTYQKYCPMILSRVLCPTDFSRYSDKVIHLIRDIPGIGEVLLFHVVSKGEAREETINRENALGKLKDRAEILNKYGISTRYFVNHGNPSTEINRLAEVEDVSLICMSSYGKGWIKDLLVGNTAAEVAKNSERPILILRTRH